MGGSCLVVVVFILEHVFLELLNTEFVESVCVCVCGCMCACMCVCVHTCVCACLHVYMCAF